MGWTTKDIHTHVLQLDPCHFPSIYIIYGLLVLNNNAKDNSVYSVITSAVLITSKTQTIRKGEKLQWSE